MSRKSSRFSVFFIVVMLTMILGLVLLDNDEQDQDAVETTTRPGNR